MADNAPISSEPVQVPIEYQKPEGLRTLANYLRSSNGVKVRSGIQHEKRVDYFKGKRLLESIVEGKKWPKSLPKITDEIVAIEVAKLLLQAQFFHRSEKVEGKKGYLKISKVSGFDEAARYTWIYAGNMTWSHIGTGAVIAAVIIFTLLPIWPAFAKHILWYVVVTFSLFLFGSILVRFVVFVVAWMIGYEFWIFPRLFDESLSFQDSFKPIYTFEKASKGQGYYRVSLIVLVAAFVYWAASQPTEFDGFIKAQKEFIDDLYAGNLLADVSQDHKDNLDKLRGKIPSLDELLSEEGGEEGPAGASSRRESNKAEDSKEDTDPTENFATDEVEEDKFDDAMFDALLNSLPDEDE